MFGIKKLKQDNINLKKDNINLNLRLLSWRLELENALSDIHRLRVEFRRYVQSVEEKEPLDWKKPISLCLNTEFVKYLQDIGFSFFCEEVEDRYFNHNIEIVKVKKIPYRDAYVVEIKTNKNLKIVCDNNGFTAIPDNGNDILTRVIYNK